MVILSFLAPPTEGVDHVQVNTKAFIDENCLGIGTLYVAKERVSWCGGNGQGFSLEYTGIAVHAVCKDTTKFPDECIYCMLDSSINANEDDDGSQVTEVRFVPEDRESLEQIFNILSDCQALHPDPQEEAEEEMAGFGGDYFSSEGDVILTEEGQATLQRLENSLQGSAGQDTVTTTTTNGKESNGHNHTDQDVEMEEEAGQFEDA